MHLRRKVLMGLGALCLMAGLSPQARADFGPSTPTAISWSQFLGAGYTAYNSLLPSADQSFAYTAGPTPSGNVISQVYSITKNGVTTYAYLYQIQPVSTSDVQQYNTDWHASFVNSPVAINGVTGPVYDITSGTAPGGPAGSVNFSFAHPQATSPSITGFDNDALLGSWRKTTGAYTPIFVVFSTTPPAVEKVHAMVDGSALSPSGTPEVYAPAPEPPAMALCGLGILGLFGAAAYRRFRPRPSLA